MLEQRPELWPQQGVLSCRRGGDSQPRGEAGQHGLPFAARRPAPEAAQHAAAAGAAPPAASLDQRQALRRNHGLTGSLAADDRHMHAYGTAYTDFTRKQCEHRK